MGVGPVLLVVIRYVGGEIKVTRATNYSMDTNEIGLGDAVADLKFDMHCPKAGNFDSGVNNWSSEQCILRVRVNNPCVVKCSHGRKIKAAMDAAGGDYKLEAFTGVAVGEKTKRKVKREENPNDKWPGRNKERNMKIAIALINGASVLSLSMKYSMSKTSVRKFSYRYYAVANPRVFAACSKQESKTEFAQKNKNLILPFLIYHREAGQSLKGV